MLVRKENKIIKEGRDGFDIVHDTKRVVRNLNDCVNNINKSLGMLEEDPSDSRHVQYIRNYCSLLIENAKDLEDMLVD